MRNRAPCSSLRPNLHLARDAPRRPPARSRGPRPDPGRPPRDRRRPRSNFSKIAAAPAAGSPTPLSLTADRDRFPVGRRADLDLLVGGRVYFQALAEQVAHRLRERGAVAVDDEIGLDIGPDIVDVGLPQIVMASNAASASPTRSATCTGLPLEGGGRDFNLRQLDELADQPVEARQLLMHDARGSAAAPASGPDPSRSVSMNMRIEVSGVRSSCDTDDRNSFWTRGQLRAPGDEDDPQRIAGEAVAQNASTRIPPTMDEGLRPAEATRMMPIAVIRTVGTSAASMNMMRARWRRTVVGDGFTIHCDGAASRGRQARGGHALPGGWRKSQTMPTARAPAARSRSRRSPTSGILPAELGSGGGCCASPRPS